MKTRIYSQDIECDSCIKVLGRVLKKMNGILSFDVTTEHIDIEHDKNVKPASLVKIIREKGYRASLEPIIRPRIRDRTKEFLTDKKKYAVEWKMLRYTTIMLLILLALEAALIFIMEAASPGFFAKYGWWLFYLAISVVALAGAIWHFLSYRTTVTCMTGMMIAMTIGMQTGMLIGAVLGATNGFFIGAMTGMLLGSAIGLWTGRCCGIMGVMEGLMAGVMGGTMGAMITVMMFADNIFWFMPFYVALNLAILAGFSYMLFEELVEGKKVSIRPLGFWPFAALTTLALAVLTALMLLAPKSIFLM